MLLLSFGSLLTLTFRAGAALELERAVELTEGLLEDDELGLDADEEDGLGEESGVFEEEELPEGLLDDSPDLDPPAFEDEESGLADFLPSSLGGNPGDLVVGLDEDDLDPLEKGFDKEDDDVFEDDSVTIELDVLSTLRGLSPDDSPTDLRFLSVEVKGCVVNYRFHCCMGKRRTHRRKPKALRSSAPFGSVASPRRE